MKPACDIQRQSWRPERPEKGTPEACSEGPGACPTSSNGADGDPAKTGRATVISPSEAQRVQARQAEANEANEANEARVALLEPALTGDIQGTYRGETGLQRIELA